MSPTAANVSSDVVRRPGHCAVCKRREAAAFWKAFRVRPKFTAAAYAPLGNHAANPSMSPPAERSGGSRRASEWRVDELAWCCLSDMTTRRWLVSIVAAPLLHLGHAPVYPTAECSFTRRRWTLSTQAGRRRHPLRFLRVRHDSGPSTRFSTRACPAMVARWVT